MKAMNQDLVLITDMQGASEQAFLQVYQQFHEKLFFYFLHKTRSNDVSEELVQCTFIKLWQHRKKLNAELPISRQLFRIAKTTLIDLLRQKANGRVVSFQSIPQVDIADDTSFLHDNHQLAIVQQHLSQLPPMQRKIVAFRLEGLSNKEIADNMAISKKTVENQVNRAIREIKRSTHLALLVLYILNNTGQ